jgi:hypothetical protein
MINGCSGQARMRKLNRLAKLLRTCTFRSSKIITFKEIFFVEHSATSLRLTLNLVHSHWLKNLIQWWNHDLKAFSIYSY